MAFKLPIPPLKEINGLLSAIQALDMSKLQEQFNGFVDNAEAIKNCLSRVELCVTRIEQKLDAIMQVAEIKDTNNVQSSGSGDSCGRTITISGGAN